MKNVLIQFIATSRMWKNKSRLL